MSTATDTAGPVERGQAMLAQLRAMLPDVDGSAAYAASVISNAWLERANRNAPQRPRDWRGRPYHVWRDEEKRFLVNRDNDRFIRSVPNGSAIAGSLGSRGWVWVLDRRTEAIPLGVTDLESAEGGRPVDGLGHRPRELNRTPRKRGIRVAESWRIRQRDAGAHRVRIAWPAGAPAVTRARPAVRVAPAYREVSPMAGVYANRIAEGWHGSPFSDIPPVHRQGCACEVCVPRKRLPYDPYFSSHRA